MTYSEYEVPFNAKPLCTPHKIRMICIGAGLAGMTLAYKIIHEKKLEDVIDFTIYERQSGVGGTWLVNRYPGLTCDVPIHVYTLPWAPKHDWTRFMAGGAEILKYIQGTAKKFDLEKCMRFNTKVLEATWNKNEGKWNLAIEREGKEENVQCDILVGATGTQNTPLKPNIPGLESFKGSVLHTGSWDANVDLKDKRVAVIGNGSSGIQAFGAIQKEASTVAHYIRTPTWISLNYMSQFTRDGRNFDYSDEEKTSFSDPKQLAAYRRKLETTSNGLFKNLVFDETCQGVKKNFRTTTERVMTERLSTTPELIKRLIPAYQPWCRRLTPGDEYLFALQRPNAALYDSQIDSVDTHGIKTKDGIYSEWDVIVTATGFVNNRIPPWKMTGLNGVTLAERWKEDADGYLSVCAPSMPNYFAVGQTPNFTIANGSVLSAFGFVTDYILRWATKIATEDIKSVVVKDEAVMAYNIYLQQVLRRTAWNGECESWYKKGRRDEYRTGITAIYPGSLNHFRSMLEKERGEDFDVKYKSANRFNFYGNGLTELDMTDGADLAFYLEKTMKLENMI